MKKVLLLLLMMISPVDARPFVIRWQNHDGLTRKEHARKVHGIDTRGMTEAEASRRADRDHDRYGGQHGFARARKFTSYNYAKRPAVRRSRGLR